MIDCNLGPDFKSCFLGHKQSEYGKTFTVRLAKHMCYEDARLVQHFVNQKALMLSRISAKGIMCCGTALSG